MGAWDAVKYGWNVVYWVTIEGIPVVFTERGLGMILPAGYELEDASLVIDDSSEVGTEIDRRRGLGAGLSLGFRLLDTATVRDYIRRPAKFAELTQNENATTNVIHVDSTAAWANAGRFWLGHELITYTGKTATTFTGCTRGVVGLAYNHALVSAGNLATSSPRWWRGRTVTLWASPINQAGVPSGAALTQDAVQVWRGRISDGPNRGMSWFDFQADSLERVLDRPLAAQLSGKVIPTATVYLPPTTLQVQYTIKTKNAAGANLWSYVIEFSPFATLDPSTYYSGDQLRKRIADEFLQAVQQAGAAAKILGLIWHPVPSYKTKAGQTLPGWAACIAVAEDAAVFWLQHDIWFKAKNQGGNWYDQAPAVFPAGLPAQELSTDWVSGDHPLSGTDSTGLLAGSLTVQLDSGLDALVPTSGLLYVEPASPELPKFVCKYKTRNFGPTGIVFGAITYLWDGSYQLPTAEQCIGAQVRVLFADEGSPAKTCLRLLHGSGTGLRSAVYDTLTEGRGYGIDEDWIDADSFNALLGAGAAGQLAVRVSPAGASFADIFAGLLALSRMAVATRTVDGQTKLACVRTDAAGGEYWHTIRDIDLLSVGADPVEPQSRLTPLNRITVTRAPYGLTWSSTGKVSGNEDAEQDTSIFSDIPAVLALGEEGLDATIPAIDNDQLTQYALPLVLATFAGDQSLQAVALSVPPWVSAQVGDLIRLELTHPSLWDYATQSPGYTGPGRVVGRTIELRTLRVKLIVLINSSTNTKTLAPAARVSSWTGPANNPLTIDVGAQYLPHFTQALVQNGWAWCQHYKPGQTESTGNKFSISSVAKVGAFCRLTLTPGAWAAGTLSTAEWSTITVPSTNDSNDWQKTYTHAGDGSIWS